MSFLQDAVAFTNHYLWDYLLLFLLCGTGVYFTLRLRFIQVLHFGESFRRTFGGIRLRGAKADGQGMSSFQSLATAVAAQVGTGNLAGAATALIGGGPGAIFWMWLSAFFGMATIFAEATLAQKFKTTRDGEVTGGPAYYIRAAFKGRLGKVLAGIFSVLVICALGFMGNMVQSNSIGAAFRNAFGIPPLVVGVLVAAAAGFVFLGGVQRIASVTEKIVPVMALFYIIGAFLIIAVNFRRIPDAFAQIFTGAFSPQALAGGAMGITVQKAIRFGVARGLFSNESGLGSAPIVVAAAKTKWPAEQGLISMTGTFIDTIIICTLTGLTIIVSGAWLGDTNGAALTQAAFSHGYGAVAPILLTVSLTLFAFTTILGWNYYGERCLVYLVGVRGITPYRLCYVAIIAASAFMQLEEIWALADIVNGLMAIPNLIALLGLTGVVVAETKRYFQHLAIRDAKLVAYKARHIGKK